MAIAMLIFTIIAALGTVFTAFITFFGFRLTKKEIIRTNLDLQTGNLDLKNEIRRLAGIPPLQK